MGLTLPSQDITPPDLSKGNFEGYVINVNDSDKRQRVRIRIPVLHRDIPDEYLPWANIQQTGVSNAGSGVGTVNVPDRYAKIMVTYPDGDAHNPQYGPSPTSDDVNKDNELNEDDADYPNSYGHVDSFGNRFSTNRATGDITIAHYSGTTVHIDGSGNISIAGAADLYIACKNNMSFAAGGRIKMSAAGDISFAGANVHLNSDSPDAPIIPGKRSKPSIPDQSNKTSL